MSIQFIAGSTYATPGNTSSSFTPAVPAGLATNDIVIAALHWLKYAIQPTTLITPGGWTLAASYTGSGPGAIMGALLWHPYSGETGNYTFNLASYGAGTMGVCALAAYRGVSTTAPIDQVQITPNSNTAPSVTTTAANEQIVSALLSIQGYSPMYGAPVAVQPSGDTLRESLSINNYQYYQQIAMLSDDLLAAAGASGARAFQLGSGNTAEVATLNMICALTNSAAPVQFTAMQMY